MSVPLIYQIYISYHISYIISVCLGDWMFFNVCESVHVRVMGLRVECQRWQRPVYAADGGTGSCQSPD